MPRYTIPLAFALVGGLPQEDEYFITCSLFKDNLNLFSLLGHTETQISQSPTFQTTINVEGSFECVPRIRVELYKCLDRQPLDQLFSHLNIASVTFDFTQLLSSTHHTHTFTLKNSQTTFEDGENNENGENGEKSENDPITITLKALLPPPQKLCAIVRLRGVALSKKSLFGSDDTRIECVRIIDNDLEEIVYKSHIIYGSQNPQYPEFVLNITKLCDSLDKPFKIRICRVKGGKNDENDDIIGQAIVTPNDLLINPSSSSTISRNVEVPLIDLAGKAKSRGSIIIQQFLPKELPTLEHFLEKGLEIRYSFGIDFTETHVQRTYNTIQETYINAMNSFGKVLDPYLLPSLSSSVISSSKAPSPLILTGRTSNIDAFEPTTTTTTRPTQQQHQHQSAEIPVWGYNGGYPSLLTESPSGVPNYDNNIFPLSLDPSQTGLTDLASISQTYLEISSQLTTTKQGLKLRHPLVHLRHHITNYMKLVKEDVFFIHFIFTSHRVADAPETSLEFTLLKDRNIPVAVIFVGIDGLGNGSNSEELSKLQSYANEPKTMDKKGTIRYTSLHYVNFDPQDAEAIAKDTIKGLYSEILQFIMLNEFATPSIAEFSKVTKELSVKKI